MKIRSFGFLLITLLIAYGCQKDQKIEIPYCISPDSNVKVSLALDNIDGRLSFTSTLANDTLVYNSPLGIALEDHELFFLDSLKFLGHTNNLINERYTMLTGKQKERHIHCNESKYTFVNSTGKSLTVVVRVFNDGLAFRYEVQNMVQSSVIKEHSAFNFKSSKSTWTIDYSSGDERVFEKSIDIQKLQGKPLSLPVLVESHSGNWMLATESDVSNFPLAGGMFVNGQLKFIFPGSKKGKNVVDANFKSPWRVLMMGQDLGTITASCMVDHLAQPSTTNDVSWIKPGVTSFPWWGDNLANSSPETLKKYIDLSASMGWDYIEFDVPLINSPAHAIDDWKTTPWIKDIVDYGKEKGVACYGWDEFKNLNTPEKRKDIFSRYNQLGIVGCKVDFINSYSQDARKILEDIIKDAAKYKLMLSFHGAQSPRGFARTYPHIMSYEAVKGSEYYLSINGAKGLTPYHNATLPFTRNVLGSMDYTPVAFTTNLRSTTMAHELALSVVFESGWQGMCDIPKAYLESPAKVFLSDLPATWDETKLLDGYPGEFCVMARRKGDTWYVGGISALDSKEFFIDLSHIISGTLKTTIYQDKAGVEDILETKDVLLKVDVPLKVSVKKNGGFAFIIPGKVD